MDFNEFYQQALKIKNLPLPGEESHHKMSPTMRIQWLISNDIQKRNPKQAGVLALFYPDLEQQTKMLLILRKAYEGVHSNQIGFPGGKVEEGDRSLEETALRETFEEVGVLPTAVEVIKELSELYIPPSNFMVRPYMGFYPEPKPFVKQQSEVEALVEVNLSDFLDNGNRIEETLSTSYAKSIDVPAYKLNGYTVWGATAMMLSEIQDLLEQVL
ncbi:NUDIX hydrolase [Flagellimonas myxillae]|uniref:NUDIX hydrolase n=1 Tax=Flagellimonas myxillae TaxID=2942214 RepID=UPI00201FAB10|nr:CoA pyrophosphatase [Muricauda myxillae]MCL6266456.1 CoA pyrophosphatase [Muricauda myxillae]